MKKKKLLAVVMILLLCLVGCGEEKNIDYLSNRYQVETKIISEDSILFDVCNGVTYFVSQDEIELLDIDSSAETLIQMSIATDEKLWFLGRNSNAGGNYFLYSCDTEEQFLKKVEMEDVVSSNVVATICSDQDGNLCIYDTNGKIYVWSVDGIFLFQKQMSGHVVGTGTSVDGNILLTVNELGECAVYEIEIESKKVEKKFGVKVLNGLVGDITEISKEMYMFWTDEQIIIWDGEKGEEKDTFNLNTIGIRGAEVDKICYQTDGIIKIYQQNVKNGKGVLKETILYPKENSERNDEKILTFATYGDLSYEGTNKIVAFNSSEHDYKIQVVDYKVGDRSYEEALVCLQADIMSGNGPDIIGLESFDFENLCYGGILESLNSYMEEDDSFNTGDYFENVLGYYEKDGQTYGLITEFRVIAGMINEELISRYNEWTVDDIYRCLDENSQIEVMFGTYRSNVLNLFLLDRERFWNQDTRKCCFDTNDFKRLLEYSYKYGYASGKKPNVSVEDGTRLVEKYLAFDPIIEQMSKSRGLSCQGIPTGQKSRMLIGKDGIAIAMAACSDNKQEVWEFMKFCLSKEIQISETHIGMSTYPVRKENFSVILNGWSESVNYSYYVEGIEYKASALSDEGKQQFTEYVEEMVLMEHLDTVLFNIIMEEAEFYFDGTKTVEQVVELIQNRAQLYMDEISD